MNGTIVNITVEQIDEDNQTKINVEAHRNDRYCFMEGFTTTEKPVDVHLFTEKEISEEQTYKSVSATVLTELLERIINGEKTHSKAPNAIEEEFKFGLTDLLTIKKFERIANVRFDYSKFKTLGEFQRYFQLLLKEDKREDMNAQYRIS